MSVIKITVDEQNLHITDSPKIAAQGVNENQVEFTFSADWDGFGKTAIFYNESDPETVYTSLVDGNGLASIPHEITASEGRISLGLSGVKDNVVKTSEILTYKIVKGLYIAESAEPSPGIYEQMLTMVGAIQSDQADFISEIEADQAAFKSEIEASIAEIESETSSGINVIDARVDNLVADTRAAESTTIWSGNMSVDGGTYTLSQNVSNFDFLDIFYDNQYSGVTHYLRIPADKTAANIYVPYFETESVNKPLEIGKVSLSFSGTSVTVSAAKQYFWDGTFTSEPSILDGQFTFPVRIDGVKTASNVNAELADIRVGADGTTYASAGAAVRGQIGDLKADYDKLFYYPTLTANDVVEGYYVRGDNGYISASGSYVCTDFISLDDSIKGTALQTLVTMYSYIGCAFYNSAKQYISGISGTSEGLTAITTKNVVLTIPENAAYFRTTLRAASYTSPADFKIGYVNMTELASLKNNVENLTDDFNTHEINAGQAIGYTYDLKFEQGAIGGNGVPYNSNKDIRTGMIQVPPSRYSVSVNGYRVYVLFYNENGTWQSDKNIWAKTSDFTFDVTDENLYARFCCNKTSGEEITPVDNAITLKNQGIYNEFVEARGEYNTLNSRLNAIESGGEGGELIPAYFTDAYLSEKLADINENAIVSTGTSFAFITDVHLEDNADSSKYLMKYFLDKTPISFVMFGGDVPTAYSAVSGNEKAEVLELAKEWLEWVNYWGSYRVYQMRGNHDYVKPSRTDSTLYYNMPDGGVHQYVMSKFSNIVHGNEPDKNYYYFDNEIQKIRYIVLDGHTYNSSYPSVVVSYIFAKQINWFIDVLNNSDGYHIVVLSHEATDSAMQAYAPNMAIIQTIAEAFKNRGTVSQVASGVNITADFTNATGELVCILSGHSHRDESHVSNNVLAISTTCDAYYNNDPNVTREQGTITESAFDIFSIDTTNRTIKTVRIGAGSDRSWTY